MYQKDYILRMITMLMKFIGEVLGLIKKGDLKQASDRLEKGYNTFLKEDAAFFKNIPSDRLPGKLLEDHNYTAGHVEILAELFNTEAELKLVKNDLQGSLEFSEKSLILFEFVDKEYRTYSEGRLKKMEKLKNNISRLKEEQYDG